MVAARPGRTIFENERDRQRNWAMAVRLLDWNRVLLEAMGLHMSRRQGGKHGQRLFSTDAETAVCGDCIRDVLLATDNPRSQSDG